MVNVLNRIKNDIVTSFNIKYCKINVESMDYKKPSLNAE